MAVRQEASTGEIVDDQKPAIITNQPTSDDKLTMHIKVYSPFRTYFDDRAFSISAVNDSGPFDILPRHHNFMTLVNACVLVIVAPSGTQRIKISQAVMHVKADEVRVFLDV